MLNAKSQMLNAKCQKPKANNQKPITILGSTGSIGQQTLAIIRRYPRKFKILGLANNTNWRLLQQQIQKFKPKLVATNCPQKISAPVQICSLIELAQQKANLVVNGLSGSSGVAATLAALKKGNDVALANKEALVIAGPFLRRAAKKSGAKIWPVDSEHAALFQLLQGRAPSEIHQVILTASGGALRDYPLKQLHKVTPAQVLRHPTWQMGAKVTVDSATLANKAFEVIEAAELFQLPLNKIKILGHPQSLVHALVELKTGETLAALAQPSMLLPIGNALFKFQQPPQPHFNFCALANQNLQFHAIDYKRYPIFPLILQAAQQGLLARAVAAYADEVAVEKFLHREIAFPEISNFVAAALRKIPRGPATLKNIFRIRTEI